MKKIVLPVLIMAFFAVMICSFNRKPVENKENKIEGMCNRTSIEYNENEVGGGIDILKMIEDLKNFECVDCVGCEGCDNPDSISFPADIDLLIDYCKQPSLKLAPNVEQFLDSIEAYTGIPVHMPDPPEDELGIVHRAVHELRRYQTGERKYYPKEEVIEALDYMGLGLGDIWSHSGDYWYICLYYWANFATQAALLSPRVELVSHIHAPDHQIGLLSYHEWSPSPLMTFLVRQRENYCTIQLVDEEVDLKKIFLVSDNHGRDYYLLSSSVDDIMMGNVDAYLFLRSADDVSFVAKGSLSYASVINNPFFDEIPLSTDDRGVTKFNIVYSDFAIEQANKYKLTPDALMDSLQFVYNPSKYHWDLCIRNGGEYWHKIEGTKSLYLHLEGDEPYFETH